MSTAPTHPPLDLDPTPATPIVLGTMAWGSVPPPPPDADPGAGPEGPAGEAQAEAAVERARRALRAGIEAGVDLLDTADIYGAGRSEETVGRLLHELPYEERSALKVQTKCGIVLDEVDAPLDDANVDRFCRMLDEMRKRTDTRFIVITHNPVTMSRMDRLYGVTMPERGMSQLVSVDLKRAEAMVA